METSAIRTQLIQKAGVQNVVQLNQPKRYHFLDIDQMYALPPSKWIVNKILPANGLAQIYGAPASGKSFITLDMVMHLAGGFEWFGNRVIQTPVTYLALEGGQAFQNRIKAWEKRHEDKIAAVKPNIKFILEKFNLTKSEDIAALLEGVLENSLVVIDTQARASSGTDENSGKDMNAIIDGASLIQETINGTVLLVAHTGKDTTKGTRGHSSQQGAIDLGLEVKRNGDIRSLEITKAKDSSDNLGFNFKLQPLDVGWDYDNDEAITSCYCTADNVPSYSKTQSKQVTFSKNQQLAIDAFNNVVADTTYEIIKLGDWRNEFKRLYEYSNAEATKQAEYSAWGNSFKQLIKYNHVKEHGLASDQKYQLSNELLNNEH